MSQPHLSAAFPRHFLKVTAGDAADVVSVTPGHGQRIVIQPGAHPGDTVRLEVVSEVGGKRGAA